MQELLTQLKREIVITAHKLGEGHIPSALSILDIIWVLYDKVLDIDPKNPGNAFRDRLILSKGHASLALYIVLAEKGFFPKDELENFGTYNSILGGHPDRNKIPGVETSTGSLGHGFPTAVGIALGMKIKNINSRVYVIVGDGELNEGTMWEAALLAKQYNLDNLYCIVDNNHSTDRALNMGNVAEKFEAFGWCSNTIDGHKHQNIYDALTSKKQNTPNVVIANTVKGNGCRIMENNPAWHHRAPDKDELKHILEDIL